MKSITILLRLISIYLCLWELNVCKLVAQSQQSIQAWDKPHIFTIDSITRNSIVLPVSLPRATFIFDSTGKEAFRVPMNYQRRSILGICYQIALDSLFTRSVTGTAIVDSEANTIFCSYASSYVVATYLPLPNGIVHIDSAFTVRFSVSNLNSATQYYVRACTKGSRDNNDVTITSFPSNTIKFTTLRETSVREEAVGGGAFTLEQNAPNPFSDETSINFALPETSDVSLTIHDTFGRVVMEVAKGRMSAGRHRYTVLMNSLPSGVYSYRLGVSGRILSRQMVHVR